MGLMGGNKGGLIGDDNSPVRYGERDVTCSQHPSNQGIGYQPEICIENGLRITCLMGKCAIEMSDGVIGLKRFLSFDEITSLVDELNQAKELINAWAIQEDGSTHRIDR